MTTEPEPLDTQKFVAIKRNELQTILKHVANQHDCLGESLYGRPCPVDALKRLLQEPAFDA